MKQSKIYIPGHLGMVGSAIFRLLKAEGFGNLLVAERGELDLRIGLDVDKFFEINRPEYVIFCAAKVGDSS